MIDFDEFLLQLHPGYRAGQKRPELVTPEEHSFVKECTAIIDRDRANRERAPGVDVECDTLDELHARGLYAYYRWLEEPAVRAQAAITAALVEAWAQSEFGKTLVVAIHHAAEDEDEFHQMMRSARLAVELQLTSPSTPMEAIPGLVAYYQDYNRQVRPDLAMEVAFAAIKEANGW